MEEETKKALIEGSTEIIKEAYEDAFKPPAKEIGKALGTIGKGVNVALAPVRGVIWGWEQIEEYIKTKVTEKLEQRGVKEEDIVTPDPDIAVPTIEAMRYTKLKNECANLLATSMLKSKAYNVHPSFVEILKQLTPDEVKVLNQLPVNPYPHPFIYLKRVLPESKGDVKLGAHFGDLAKKSLVEYPQKMETYMNNLERLGIIEFGVGSHLTEASRYDECLSDPYVKEVLARSTETNTFDYDKTFFRYTALGIDFISAVLDPK